MTSFLRESPSLESNLCPGRKWLHTGCEGQHTWAPFSCRPLECLFTVLGGFQFSHEPEVGALIPFSPPQQRVTAVLFMPNMECGCQNSVILALAVHVPDFCQAFLCINTVKHVARGHREKDLCPQETSISKGIYIFIINH